MPLARRSPQIPALALLGVAIVCLHHWLPPTITHGILRGAYGAELLFVLTGFLVTTVALRARRAHEAGHLSHTKALRNALLHPLVFAAPAYIALLVALALLTDPSASLQLSLWTLTYNVRAIVHGELTGTLAHLWAPSIAFWFLLLWIPCLLGFRRQRLVPLAVLLVVLGPLSRLVLAGLGAPHVMLRCAGVTSGDALGAGALLALLIEHHGAQAVAANAWTRISGVGGALLILAGMALQYDRVEVDRALWQTLVVTTKAPFYFWLFAAAARGFGGPGGRLLASRPAAILARAGFSMYLAHAFAPPVARAGVQVPLLPMGLLLIAAVTLIAGLVSRYLFEERFTPLLRRFPLDAPQSGVRAERAAA